MTGSTANMQVGTASEHPLIGYLEAMGDQGALGWAWSPGSTQRLKVELRLREQVLQTGVADKNRDDLARSGIGDGKHAFALDIPEGLRGRTSELSVLAYPVEGPAVQLTFPPAQATSDGLDPLRQGIETLISSQRLLHRNLQAALLRQPSSSAALLTEIAGAQLKLNAAIDTIELFVVRLEIALQNREPSVPTPASRRVVAALIASGVAFLVSCWAVFLAVRGA